MAKKKKQRGTKLRRPPRFLPLSIEALERSD